MKARPTVSGYIFEPKTVYSLSAENAIGSPPVGFRVVSKADARSLPAGRLDDAALDATFHSLLNDYAGLRAEVRNPRGDWDDRATRLTQRIGALPSSGNPDSPYVLVNANLAEAAAALVRARDCSVQSCDATSVAKGLAVADYYAEAVRSELSSGIANAADAAFPPQ